MDENFIGLAAVILIFGGGGAILFSITPIGKAIAARLGKKGTSDVDQETAEEVRELRAEVDELHHVTQQMSELGERVDFLERLVAKQRDAERLPPVR
jgi:hypothetical protein